jgi:hypothetical protein
VKVGCRAISQELDSKWHESRNKSWRFLCRVPGRNSLYCEDYADQAFKLCLLGAIDEELADFFGVSIATIYNWKNEHPAFLEATIAGKVKADAEVAHSLYRAPLAMS